MDTSSLADRGKEEIECLTPRLRLEQTESMFPGLHPREQVWQRSASAAPGSQTGREALESSFTHLYDLSFLFLRASLPAFRQPLPNRRQPGQTNRHQKQALRDRLPRQQHHTGTGEDVLTLPDLELSGKSSGKGGCSRMLLGLSFGLTGITRFCEGQESPLSKKDCARSETC